MSADFFTRLINAQASGPNMQPGAVRQGQDGGLDRRQGNGLLQGAAMKPMLHALLCSGLMALSAGAAALMTSNPFTY